MTNLRSIEYTGSNIDEIWETFGADYIYGPTEANEFLRVTTDDGIVEAYVGDTVGEWSNGSLYVKKGES